MAEPNGDGLTLSSEILAVLPAGSKLISAVNDGASSWSRTMRVTVEGSTGKTKQYFLKLTTGIPSKAQLEGEFHAMSELYRTVPHMIPKPYGWGEIKNQTVPTFFFLSDYLKLTHEMPDPKRLAEALANLHKKSQSQSNQFGFHITTFDGRLPQNTTWDPSWASFFTKLIHGIWEIDTQINGPWKEFDEILKRASESVIPRLLNNLTQDGDPIKPTLIHGDLWEGNIGTDIETGDIYIFDASAYYAHHEMELGIWRTSHHKMKDGNYQQEYIRLMAPSEPVEEWEDRNRLYSVKTKLMCSAHNPGAVTRREAYDDLTYLVGKYCPPAKNEATDETEVPRDNQMSWQY